MKFFDPNSKLNHEDLTDDGTSFDQFAQPKTKNNGASTYSFDLYSTRLDPHNLTKHQLKAAEKLSKEIEEDSKVSSYQRKAILKENLGEEELVDDAALFSDVVRLEKPREVESKKTNQK